MGTNAMFVSSLTDIHRRMSGDPYSDHAPRARPVADAPVDAMLARTDELARRWAIALIVARPLGQMAEVPLEELAREAPALCAQIVRALASDPELARLAAGREPGFADGSLQVSRLGGLARAPDPRDAVEEVEALRGVLWEALLEELRPSPSGSLPPTARLVGDLADRLAHACATALAAMLTQSPVARVEQTRAPAPGGGEEALFTSMRSSQDPRSAVLVDERGEAPVASAAERVKYAGQSAGPEAVGAEAVPEHVPERPQTPRSREQARPRSRPWDGPPRAERPPGRAPEARADGVSRDGGGGEPVMRVTRRSSAPTDKRS
jgi:hypothetical protein